MLVGSSLPSRFPCPEVAGSTPANDKLLNQTTSDTWHARIGPRVNIPLATKRTHVKLSYANCLPINNLPHHHMSHQRTVVRPCHVSLYGLYSQRPFFACLPFRTDCDISRSRRPFETKRVALGSQRRGLRSRPI
jgi:hypothetical protein